MVCHCLMCGRKASSLFCFFLYYNIFFVFFSSFLIFYFTNFNCILFVLLWLFSYCSVPIYK